MKKLGIIFALIAALVCSVNVDAKKKKNADGNPLIQFTETSHNFGTINRDKPVSTEFEFINAGNAPLVIYDATADCGCTRPEYPKNPIAPGKKGKIKVTFLPNSYVGSFMKNVKVKSNASKKTQVLKISGIVNPNNDKKK